MIAFITIFRVSELYHMDIIPAFFYKITLGTRELSQWLWVCYCCSRESELAPSLPLGYSSKKSNISGFPDTCTPIHIPLPPHIIYTTKSNKKQKLHLYTVCMYSHIMVHVCTNMNVWVCKSENILKSQFSLPPNSGFLTRTFPHWRQVYSSLIPASPDNEVFHITKGRLSSNLIYLSYFSLICKNKRQVGLGGMYYIKTNKQTRTQKDKTNKQKQKDAALTLFLVSLLQEERLQNIDKNVHFHVHARSVKLLRHSFQYLPLRRPPQAFSGFPSLPFTMLGWGLQATL